MTGARTRTLARGAAAVIAALLLASCDDPDGTPGGGVTTHSVGGTVTGLAGAGLALRNNGADDLAVVAGTSRFTFPTRVARGSSYAVTVGTHPTNRSQTCTVTNGNGTVTGDVTNVAVACTTNTYAVRADVSGLTGTGLVLRKTPADDLPVAASGLSTFAGRVQSGASYTVTVHAQPSGQLCAITANGTGTIGAADATVQVACRDTRGVAVTVTGLVGSGLVLRNGGENLAVSANGRFTFPTRIADGAPYAVTVATAPKNPTQVCALADATGVVGGADAEVSVRCTERHLTNGAVRAIAHGADGTTYLGGTFDWIGPATGGGVPLDAATARRGPYPYVDGRVWAVVPDGQGGWYIGGTFEAVGGVARSHLAHVLASGAVDPAWNPSPDAIVYSLAIRGSTVYVGGAFRTVGGANRDHIAALDATTGFAKTWNAGANDDVFALAVGDDGSVYAGGKFSLMGDASRYYIAKLDASGNVDANFHPRLTGSWDTGHSGWGTVHALAVSGTTVYAGGEFVTVDDQDRKFAAALDAGSGALKPWNPAPSIAPSTGPAPVWTLAVDGSTVYAGGGFTTIGGQARRYLAALDATTGAAAAGWVPDPDAAVDAVAVAAGTVWAAGRFTTIGGQPRRHVAALDASGAATTWRADANNWVAALAASGTKVYLGGWLTSVGGVSRRYLAALDPVTGDPTSWNPSPDGHVFALAVDGGTVYAGGSFAHVAGEPRACLAAVAASTGTATPWDPGVGVSPSCWVHAIAVKGGGPIYVAGDFATVGGLDRSRLAAIAPDGTVTGWNPGPNGAVHALVLDGDSIFAGGEFSTIGGDWRTRLAELDAGGTGAVRSWSAAANATVRALRLDSGTLYVGGEFTTLAGATRYRLGAVDAATGAARPWNPNLGGAVRALAIGGGRIYAGGDFDYVGTGWATRYGLASFDVASGAVTSWNPGAGVGLALGVTALAERGGVVYVGAGNSTIGGVRNTGYAELTP